MKNRIGFTLVELLAVIMILGIIVLIATGSVVDIVENAETKTAERASDLFIKTADNILLTDKLDNSKSFENDQYYTVNQVLSILETKGISHNGTIPEDGYIYINNNKVEAAEFLVKGIYIKCESDFCEGSIADEVPEEGIEFDIDDAITQCDPKVREAVTTYFNPETGKACTKEDYEINLKNYNPKGIPTGLKTGCLKWHIYDFNYDTNQVSMILDHNTTAKATNQIEYISSEDHLGNNVYLISSIYDYTDNIFNVLRNDTLTWLGVKEYSYDVYGGYTYKQNRNNWDYYDDTELNSTIKTRARFMEFNELYQLSDKANMNWYGNDYNESRYLDSCFAELSATNNFRNYRTLVTSPAHYLYNNTDCENFGCEKTDESTFGYYVFEDQYNLFKDQYSYARNQTFAITYQGRIKHSPLTPGRSFGIRPVILINASVVNFTRPSNWQVKIK